jgi:hypothetical protein
MSVCNVKSLMVSINNGICNKLTSNQRRCKIAVYTFINCVTQVILLVLFLYPFSLLFCLFLFTLFLSLCFSVFLFPSLSSFYLSFYLPYTANSCSLSPCMRTIVVLQTTCSESVIKMAATPLKAELLRASFFKNRSLTV